MAAGTPEIASETALAFEIPIWAWAIFAIFISAMLALDLGVFHKKNSKIAVSGAMIWSGIWVALAGVACALIAFFWGGNFAELFATGYLLELSLSVDNLFVFMLIFSYFRVPENLRHRVLFWGILGAIFARTIFIGGGVVLVEKFSWLMYVFGAVMLYTGGKMLFGNDSEEIDFSKKPLIKLAKKTRRMTENFLGNGEFFTKIDGKIFFTPLLLALVVIELSDVMFAFDSVPAVIGIIPKNVVPEAAFFLAITSNIFAILGLRSFFFVISHFVEKLRFMKFGLGSILILIGIKFFCEESDFYHFSPTVSLVLLVAILGISVALSWIFPEKKSSTEANS